jgi:hypothetical protein
MADEPKKTVTKEPAPKETAPEAAPSKPANPTKIKLLAPYGYIDSKNKTHWWGQWHEITSAEDIETIISHGFKNFRVIEK